MKKILIVVGIILLLLPTVLAISKSGRLCSYNESGTQKSIPIVTYHMKYNPDTDTGILRQVFHYSRKIVTYQMYEHTTVPFNKGYWKWTEGYNVIRINDDYGVNAFFYKQGKCSFFGFWQWYPTPRYCEPEEVDVIVMDKYGDVVINSLNIDKVLHIDESPYTASLLIKNGECYNRRWTVCFYAEDGELNSIIYENSEKSDLVIQREGYDGWCYYTTDLMNENEIYEQNLILYPNATNGRIDIDVYDEFADRGITFYLDWAQ